jgi:transcriptional regulator of met regulon
MDIKKAKENREEFLTPYKEKFRKSESEKERSKIISKLIAIEPSHLTEPWIIKEVVNWMRDRNSFDYLEEAFIKAPKRYASTEKQELNQVRDVFVRNEIDRIITEEGVSVRKACKRFVPLIPDIMSKFEAYIMSNFGADFLSNFEGDKYLGWDVTAGNHELERAIRQVYQNAKESPERLLPWPYYGKDVEIDENGKVIIFGGR